MTETLPEGLCDLTSATRQLSAGPGLTHLSGVAGSTLALLAARLAPQRALTVLLTADVESAERLRDDLVAALGESDSVALLPAAEATPYDGVRSDRRLAMQRAACLSALDRGAVRVLVLPVVSLLRRAAPPSALAAGTLHVTLGDSLDPTRTASALERAGYLRCPVVEDPGSFALRGGLLDVWPSGDDEPLRIELFGDEVTTLRRFDPESQRSGGVSGRAHELRAVAIAPAREAVLTAATQDRALLAMRALCDAINLPSTRARPLVEDVAGGRLFVGSDAYLPAYGPLEPLTERLPAGTALLVDDPPRVLASLQAESDRALLAASTRHDDPHFPLDEHYVSLELLERGLARLSLLACHRAAIASPATDNLLDALACPPLEIPTLGSRSQDELTAHLDRARRQRGRQAGLDPLIEQLNAWRQQGLDVTLTARVATQADRLASLLAHRDIEVTREPPELVTRPVPGRLRVVTSGLARGALLEGDALVYLTEEEIFGRRQHRAKARTAAGAVRAALDDLRALSPGDYIVHVEHGIGRYLGLEHRKVADVFVDLIAIEYRNGDKLYLPAYRLNQVQKYAGNEASPSLDRLGGATFAKTKAKVRKQVRQLADQLLKLYAERAQMKRPALEEPDDDYAAFEAAFPYEETPDQAAAIADVISDLQRETVMDRLVCGDVGFGKTEVALRAAFLHVAAGHQVALLCPTTVLAQQHLQTFSKRLEGSGAEVRALSRFQSKKEQSETLAALKAGRVDVLVGTHRVLSADVHFKQLGLLIIDEEQRFGVTHKERMKQMKRHVDVLTLSATPIPRTLGMAVGGLRDMSVIATPPSARRAIRTLTSTFDEQLIVSAVERELNRGGQVFYVYNRVEGIYERAARLQALMPQLRIGIGHGKLSERELEKTMLNFVDGEYDVLVATAIVESGLDIPRANTIIVDRADLFGLSQLYQLRGRVGRSSERAYCYLLVPAASAMTDEARSRIEALERYTELGSGFHVATLDMELRGSGELLGADQSGFMASVGFDLFCQMLDDARAELSGQPVVHDVDPELSIDVEALLPEDYVEDVGVRLSLYKRYAAALDEDDVARISEEIADRFGQPPPEARRLAEMMRLKTELRRFKALGCQATPRVVTLHLRADTPLTPAQLVPFLASQGRSGATYALSPDGRLTRRAASAEAQSDGLDHTARMLSELTPLLEASTA